MSAARRSAVLLVQAGVIVGICLLWSVASGGWVHAFILPKPSSVLEKLIDLLRSGAFWHPLSVTASEFAIAFLSALVVGIAAGFLISRRKLAVRTFDPLLAALYSVPLVLLLPLFVLLYGIGMGSKIALGFAVAFFPIALSTIAGFLTVDPSLQRAARSMGASQMQLLRNVLLPASLPVVLSGARIAMITSLLSILGAEAIASLDGLGHEIVKRTEYLQTAEMYAYLVITVAFAMLVNGLALFVDSWGRRRFA